MLISKLGEFGLIERFKKAIKLDASVVRGTGDDCAVIKLDKNRYELLTCDMLVEGVDFLAKDNPYWVGRKSIAVSISDIAACAGTPRYCLVALGMPKNTPCKFVDLLFKGMNTIAKEYKINIVGGDLSSSERIVIDVSIQGIVEKEKLCLRSTAREKDIIFVTGTLGGSIRGKHLKFTPRLKEARFLVNNFKINSMIDISDGLVGDLGHILSESKVQAIIYEDLIPLSRQACCLEEALYMGEDFELLFTVSLKQAREILRKKIKFMKPIGEIVRQKNTLIMIDKKSRSIPLNLKGYKHF